MAINRTRRSSLERRCISKSTKRLFKGTGKTMFKVMYAAECHARNRKGLGANHSLISSPGCRKVTGASFI
jgi:hypothetical protein